MNDEYELRWIYVYIVYNCKIEGFPYSDLLYIGQTADLKKRHIYHTKNKHSKSLADKFIRTHKYEFIPLCCGFKEDIDSMEKYLIREWNTSFYNKAGLNLQGGGCFSSTQSDETIIKKSKSLMKKVNQYNKSGEYIQTFESIRSTKTQGFTPSLVINCCKGIYKLHKGYQWGYFKDNTDCINIAPYNSKRRSPKTKRKCLKSRVPIIMLELDGTYIKEFDSSQSAGIELGVNATSITACCRGKRSTAYGFKWVYKDIYTQNDIDI